MMGSATYSLAMPLFRPCQWRVVVDLGNALCVVDEAVVDTDLVRYVCHSLLPRHRRRDSPAETMGREHSQVHHVRYSSVVVYSQCPRGHQDCTAFLYNDRMRNCAMSSLAAQRRTFLIYVGMRPLWRIWIHIDRQTDILCTNIWYA